MADVSGSTKRPSRGAPIIRRAGVWLVWWVMLMSLWIIMDDSLATDELLAGAGAAALGAFFAELAGYQAGGWLRLRARWLGLALRLPADLVRDTWIVFAALWRRLAHGVEPCRGFREIPVRCGGQTIEDKARRALLVGGMSFAPNSFVLGIDPEREVMVVHQLVLTEDGGAG